MFDQAAVSRAQRDATKMERVAEREGERVRLLIDRREGLAAVAAAIHQSVS